MDIRVRRAADLTEGDTILNQSLGKSWFVYEVLYEQLTKLCLSTEITGQQLTRTRTGAVDVVISPVWILQRASSTTKLVPYSGREVLASAHIRMPVSADVKAGDVLRDTNTGLTLYVFQILPALSLKTAICQEVPMFIPDEFDRSIVESFWTGSLAGGAVTVESTGVLNLALPAPAVQLAENGAFIYQVVKGDFDVYARLSVTNNLAGAEKTFGFISARLDSTHGVAVAHRGENGAVNVTRLDQYGASSQDTGDLFTAGNYVRLKRVGNVFYCYYSSNGGTTPPTAESEWALIEQSGQVVSGSGDVQLGIGGYKASGAAANTLAIEWIRNWMTSSAGTTIKAMPKVGIGLAGTRDGNNKVFILPESILAGSEVLYWNGQRQIRGDDYNIAGSVITFSAEHPAPGASESLIADYLTSL